MPTFKMTEYGLYDLADRLMPLLEVDEENPRTFGSHAEWMNQSFFNWTEGQGYRAHYSKVVKLSEEEQAELNQFVAEYLLALEYSRNPPKDPEDY